MTYTTIKKGTKGTEVYVLQALLRALQYLGKDGKPLAVDGDAGTNTVYAINSFKKAQAAYGANCGSANGQFTKTCWERLLG